jgi:8-oxo-dGTP diphosphatase
MVNGSETRQPTGDTAHADQFELRRGAKALITAGESVLLVRERHDDGTPFWTLPGGGIEPTEQPTAALCREIREELRCSARIVEPETRFWYVHHSLANTVSMYTVYECFLRGTPEPNPAEGIFEYRWVGPDSVPATTLPQVKQICASAVDN